MGFVNPGVDSDDEDDVIIKQERSFSGVCTTFVNYWYVSLHLGSMLFPKFMKSCGKENLHIENSIFNTTTKLKCCKL